MKFVLLNISPVMKRNLISGQRQFLKLCYKFSTSSCKCKSDNIGASKVKNLSRIRNIGILAHIDAGKTTTTERMLFYSGKISSMGEVHHGNTVTDYMDQERNRGITISSAVVSFSWKNHMLNLVDTPGHIDFTMGVEQSLGVIDSAVIVLDSSAGVEAQTVTVWRQTDRQGLPRLVFANKFDRLDADMELCIQSLKEKLDVMALPLHVPLRSEKRLKGLIDIVKLEEYRYDSKIGDFSIKFVDRSHPQFDEVMEKRLHLTDVLSSLDDDLAETILKNDSLEDITYSELSSAIRRATLSKKAVPLICGSAYKNIGVQMLMDSIVEYLPSPLDSSQQELYDRFGSHVAARVFKIMHDKQKGPITFCRVYSGQLAKGQKIYNVNQDKSEVIGKIMMAFADDFEEVPSITVGSLAAVTGLKGSAPGDLLCSNANTLKTAKQGLIDSLKLSEEEVNSLLQLEKNIPEPVFFCSIEPPSQAYQTALERALDELHQEDPSLRVTYDSETGQTVLAGMGELHLEIIKERIRSEYKIDADMGPLQIVYKEEINSEGNETVHLKQSVGSHNHNVLIKLSLKKGSKKEVLLLDNTREAAANLSNIYPRHLSAIKRGVSAALSHGPLLSSQVVDVYAVLNWLEVGKGTSETMVAAAASQCVQKILKTVHTKLLEPVMLVDILANEEHTTALLGELSKRRSSILGVQTSKNSKEIKCETPLVELLGFAKDLRTLTSGTANFTMAFSHYQSMTAQDETEAIKKNLGI